MEGGYHGRNGGGWSKGEGRSAVFKHGANGGRGDLRSGRWRGQETRATTGAPMAMDGEGACRLAMFEHAHAKGVGMAPKFQERPGRGVTPSRPHMH
jgi:hypothetical protein